MIDWGRYLSTRTCAHFIDSVGGPDSKYWRDLERKGLFKYDSSSRTFNIFNGYAIGMEDECPAIKLFLHGPSGVIHQKIYEDIKELRVPGNYRDVLGSIKTKAFVQGSEILRICLDINPCQRDNSEGRTQNKDDLFFAINNSATKPVLKAVLNSP